MDAELIRKICLSFPATEEEVKWGSVLCFMVARKMFCVVPMDADELRISFKTNPDDFEELLNTDGIIPAPYMARAKWVQITDMSRFRKSEIEAFLHKSYDLIRESLPLKTKKAMGWA